MSLANYFTNLDYSGYLDISELYGFDTNVPALREITNPMSQKAIINRIDLQIEQLVVYKFSVCGFMAYTISKFAGKVQKYDILNKVVGNLLTDVSHLQINQPFWPIDYAEEDEYEYMRDHIIHVFIKHYKVLTTRNIESLFRKDGVNWSVIANSPKPYTPLMHAISYIDVATNDLPIIKHVIVEIMNSTASSPFPFDPNHIMRSNSGPEPEIKTVFHLIEEKVSLMFRKTLPTTDPAKLELLVGYLQLAETIITYLVKQYTDQISPDIVDQFQMTSTLGFLSTTWLISEFLLSESVRPEFSQILANIIDMLLDLGPNLRFDSGESTAIPDTFLSPIKFPPLAAKIPEFYRIYIRFCKSVPGFGTDLEPIVHLFDLFTPEQNDEILQIFLNSVQSQYLYSSSNDSPINMLLMAYGGTNPPKFSERLLYEFIDKTNPLDFNENKFSLPIHNACTSNVPVGVFEKILRRTTNINNVSQEHSHVLTELLYYLVKGKYKTHLVQSLQKLRLLLERPDIDVNGGYDKPQSRLVNTYSGHSNPLLSLFGDKPDESMKDTVNVVIPLLLNRGAKIEVSYMGESLADLARKYKDMLDKDLYKKLVILPVLKRTQRAVIKTVRDAKSADYRWQELCRPGSDLSELRLLAKVHRLPNSDTLSKRELCKELASAFENTALYTPIENDFVGCVNDTTILGDDIATIPAMNRYTIVDQKGVKYCFDINELMSIIESTPDTSVPKNPYTKTPLPVKDILSSFSQIPKGKKRMQQLLSDYIPPEIAIPAGGAGAGAGIVNQKAIRLANKLMPNYVSPEQFTGLSEQNVLLILTKLVEYDQATGGSTFKDAMRLRITNPNVLTIETFIDALQHALDASSPESLETHKLMISEYINSISV